MTEIRVNPAQRPDPLPVGKPASNWQEHLCRVDRLYPGRPVNNLAFALSLQGTLDIVRLGSALNRVIARHEILRTGFAEAGGRFVRIPAPTLNVPLPPVDLRLLPAALRDAQAFRMAQEEVDRPFDVGKPPLIRAQLYQLRSARHILVLTVHRGIFDRESLPILLRDLATAYAGSDYAAASSASLPLTSTDAHQRAGIDPEPSESDAAWWTTRLSGSPPPLPPCGSRPPDSGAHARGRLGRQDLPASLGQSISTFCRREGASPMSVLLAAFVAILHRYTGRTDFLIGLPISGRRDPEDADALGSFEITVPMRLQFSAELPFAALLKQVRREMADASDFRAMPPLDAHNDDLKIARAVQFVQGRNTLSGVDWPGISIAELEIESGGGTSELELHFHEVPGGGLALRAQYDSSLFPSSIMQRLPGHLGVLLQAALARAAIPVGDLPLLADSERRKLAEWNATGTPYPRDATVQELVSIRARATPDALAVIALRGQLTFRELDARSNQVGRHLRAEGARPGMLIGLCLDHALELPVGLLGILKSGASLLPLDPTLPRERLAGLIDEAQPGLILTDTAHRALLPQGNARLLLIDAADIRCADDEVLVGVVGPDDTAVVIPTAGRRRLVELSQRALMSAINALQRVPGMTAEDVTLATTSVNSVHALAELLLPPACGARLVLGGSDAAAQLESLAAIHRINFIQATPSFWRTALNCGWRGGPAFRIAAAGEPLTRELADRLLRCGRELWNMYGATETAGGCLAARVSGGTSQPPIGRPLANTQVHLLDGRLQQVPAGIPGEIVVGGDCLASGYRHFAGRTPGPLVPDPFRRLPGARLFRTGDRGVRNSSGEIEFLGRFQSAGDEQKDASDSVPTTAISPRSTRTEVEIPRIASAIAATDGQPVPQSV